MSIIACEHILQRVNKFRLNFRTKFPSNRIANINYHIGVKSISSDGTITIDGIQKTLKKPENPLFVPRKFGKNPISH